jgi:hypothetical protein
MGGRVGVYLEASNHRDLLVDCRQENMSLAKSFPGSVNEIVLPHLSKGEVSAPIPQGWTSETCPGLLSGQSSAWASVKVKRVRMMLEKPAGRSHAQTGTAL